MGRLVPGGEMGGVVEPNADVARRGKETPLWCASVRVEKIVTKEVVCAQVSWDRRVGERDWDRRHDRRVARRNLMYGDVQQFSTTQVKA